MSKRTKMASVAFTGAAAAITTVAAAGPALAASSWHMRNNGTGYTGATRLKATLHLKDKTTGASLTCTGNWAGAISRSNVPATTSAKVVSITSTSVTCTNGILTFDLRLAKRAHFGAQTYHASTGEVTGKVKSLSLDLIGVRNACRATIAGSEPYSYRNSTHTIVLDPGQTAGLTFKTAVSCGVFHPGDKGYLWGDLTFTTPSRLTITRS